MKQKNKKFLCLLLIMALALTGLAACGGGDSEGPETMVLRFASEVNEANFMYKLNQEICDEIYKRTDGRIKVDFYPAAQLGAYDTVFEELMIGSIDMAQIWMLEAYDSRTSLPVVPAYSRNYEEAKVLFAQDSYMVTALDGVLAPLGIKILGMTMEGFENIASVKAVTNPYEVGPKGILLRSPPNEVTRIFLEDLGFDCMTVPWAEVPTSLQTGIIDGWMGGNLMYHYGYTGDIIKYSYVSNLQQTGTPFLMSMRTWEKISPEDQKIIQEVVSEIATISLGMAADSEAEYVEKLKERGVEVIYATDEEMATIAAFIREVSWPKYESLLSREFLDGMEAELRSKGFW